MLLLISEASMVCITLDVTAVTTTPAAVMSPSILWALISSLARLRRVEEASPDDPGRFLLSSMVLMIVTGEIPGPILHCGRCHTLGIGALNDLMCSAARCCQVFLGNCFFRHFRWPFNVRDLGNIFLRSRKYFGFSEKKRVE